ncbi:MAG: TatD family hydrolase [Methylobacterium sp.]|nr:TatD family hydrolase [Methylobacterium sp.]MCA3603855.1 TatD family hydrolase [Methylobacterium sp.]MCA3614084.1 TatD family hydrolase [Methylobacterium sp.]MCA4910556.1 TatD family hydrolase [Methylobacterium sp.]
MTPPRITDTHCHLDFPDFASDLPGVVARARAAGVHRMVTISTRVKKAVFYQGLAERFENVWFSIGTHPHNAAEEPDVTLDEIIRLSQHPKCVAIGEAGLDYHYDKSPRDRQAASFRLQIAAARITGLPLVIHARAADDDMIAILEDEMGKGAFAAILHCFSSGVELARVGVKLGLHVSFSGILTFRNSTEIRKIAAEIPLDRLLVETDAPYLAPAPHRGKTNEPAFTAHTAAVLAEVKGMSLDALAPVLEANTNRIFDKLPRAAQEAA